MCLFKNLVCLKVDAMGGSSRQCHLIRASNARQPPAPVGGAAEPAGFRNDCGRHRTNLGLREQRRAPRHTVLPQGPGKSASMDANADSPRTHREPTAPAQGPLDKRIFSHVRAATTRSRGAVLALCAQPDCRAFQLRVKPIQKVSV